VADRERLRDLLARFNRDLSHDTPQTHQHPQETLA